VSRSLFSLYWISKLHPCSPYRYKIEAFRKELCGRSGLETGPQVPGYDSSARNRGRKIPYLGSRAMTVVNECASPYVVACILLGFSMFLMICSRKRAGVVADRKGASVEQFLASRGGNDI